MHLVRAHIFPRTRRSSSAALSKRTARAPRATAAAARSREKKTLAFLRPPNANENENVSHGAQTTIDSERRLVAVAYD